LMKLSATWPWPLENARRALARSSEQSLERKWGWRARSRHSLLPGIAEVVPDRDRGDERALARGAARLRLPALGPANIIAGDAELDGRRSSALVDVEPASHIEGAGMHRTARRFSAFL